MELDVITQYLLALVPCVSALVGIVTTIGIGIAKVKKAFKENEAKSEVKEKALREQLHTIQSENIELKKTLKVINAKLNHVHFVDGE